MSKKPTTTVAYRFFCTEEEALAELDAINRGESDGGFGDCSPSTPSRAKGKGKGKGKGKSATINNTRGTSKSKSVKYQLPPTASTDSDSDREDRHSDFYSEESSIEFDEEAYKHDMFVVGAASPYHHRNDVGCNHHEGCTSDCILYHDYLTPSRRHYNIEADAYKVMDKMRYGRYVREPNTNIYIRLDDDIERPEDKPKRAHGWNHVASCSLQCKEYHINQFPYLRYKRLPDNTFVQNDAGRYCIYTDQHKNHLYTYVRLGPNDCLDYDDYPTLQPSARYLRKKRPPRGAPVEIPTTVPSTTTAVVVSANNNNTKGSLKPSSSLNDMILFMSTNPSYFTMTAGPIARDLISILEPSPLANDANHKVPKKRSRPSQRDEPDESGESDSSVSKKMKTRHRWIDDPESYTQRASIEKCNCEEGIHYRRQCAAGKRCVGKGYKDGKVSGYCSAACRP